MGKEIERKFLVTSAEWRIGRGGVRIRQFYLAAAPGRTVRVRIVDGDSARLTLKFGGVGPERDEFEYPVSLAEAAEMLAFAIGRVIAKTRHHVNHGGRLYEVDVFGGELGGLVIAELETPDDVAESCRLGSAAKSPANRLTTTRRSHSGGFRRSPHELPHRSASAADREVRRILAEEVGKALAHLYAASDKPEQALHKCRKRLKAARALLRLVRSGDETFCRTENQCYRQVAALLAGPREATALVETIDRLAAGFPEQSAGGGLDAVRDRLVARRQELHDGAGLDAAIGAAIAACEEGIGRIEKLALPDQPEQSRRRACRRRPHHLASSQEGAGQGRIARRSRRFPRFAQGGEDPRHAPVVARKAVAGADQGQAQGGRRPWRTAGRTA